MAQWGHGLAAEPHEQFNPPPSRFSGGWKSYSTGKKQKYHLRLHYYEAVTNMLGHLFASCDLLRDGRREGEGVILVTTIQKNQEG